MLTSYITFDIPTLIMKLDISIFQTRNYQLEEKFSN